MVKIRGIMNDMKNREVVEIFKRVADMLAIRGDQIHRVLAYRRAAESIEALGRDVNVVFTEGKLTERPGIGDPERSRQRPELFCCRPELLR